MLYEVLLELEQALTMKGMNSSKEGKKGKGLKLAIRK